MKDIGAVYSKNKVEIRVGFETGFGIFFRRIFFRFPGRGWYGLGDTRAVTSEEALNVIDAIFKNCIVTINKEVG